jgi:hypothetical protein
LSQHTDAQLIARIDDTLADNSVCTRSTRPDLDSST